MTAAAFFDLDRCVSSGVATFHIGRAAMRWGLYGRSALAADSLEVLRARRGGLSQEHSDAVQRRVLSAVAGRSRAELDILLPEVLGQILSRVHPVIYGRILAHEADGVPTYLCSAAPVEIVAPVATVLNMHGAIATVAELDADGRYTGNLDGPFCHGEGRLEAIRQIAKLDGLDVEASWAYTDSVTDLPTLEAVRTPVAVNPDRPLRKLAQRRGWEILAVTERHGLRDAAVAGVMAGSTAATIATAWWATRRKA